MIGAFDISNSALVAQRTRLDVIAGNLANAYTTSQADGTIEPYRRRVVALGAGRADGGPGVHVEDVYLDPGEFRLAWDPGHPHAIPVGPKAGYVQYPNVSPTLEYVDALEATRSYEANLAMMNVTRAMIQQSIQLLA
jgi:flagellar basal-body rod protein FlgC